MVTSKSLPILILKYATLTALRTMIDSDGKAICKRLLR